MRLFYIGAFIILVLIVFYLYYSMTRHKKIVVFDLDETLGHFVQLGALYDILQQLYGTINQNQFNQLLNLYPELVRHDVYEMLRFVLRKKREKKCTKIFIYTNNQGPPSWGKHIVKYFEYKMGQTLFDDIIGAYKIRNHVNDERRTSNQKLYNDIKRITQSCDKTKICFLDDQQHDHMYHDNVFYIRLPPYIYVYTSKHMTERFVESTLCKTMFPNFKKRELYKTIRDGLDHYDFSTHENVSKITSQYTHDEIMEYLTLFFTRDSEPTNKTRKLRVRNDSSRADSRFTRKR